MTESIADQAPSTRRWPWVAAGITAIAANASTAVAAALLLGGGGPPHRNAEEVAPLLGERCKQTFTETQSGELFVETQGECYAIGDIPVRINTFANTDGINGWWNFATTMGGGPDMIRRDLFVLRVNSEDRKHLPAIEDLLD